MAIAGSLKRDFKKHLGIFRVKKIRQRIKLRFFETFVAFQILE
jgi:hypothetical protein